MAGYRESAGDPATGAIPEMIAYEIDSAGSFQYEGTIKAALDALRKEGPMGMKKEHALAIGQAVENFVLAAHPNFDHPEVGLPRVHLGPTSAPLEKRLRWVDQVFENTEGWDPSARPKGVDVYTVFCKLPNNPLTFLGVILHGEGTENATAEEGPPPQVFLCRSRLLRP